MQSEFDVNVNTGDYDGLPFNEGLVVIPAPKKPQQPPQPVSNLVLPILNEAK